MDSVERKKTFTPADMGMEASRTGHKYITKYQNNNNTKTQKQNNNEKKSY